MAMSGLEVLQQAQRGYQNTPPYHQTYVNKIHLIVWIVLKQTHYSSLRPNAMPGSTVFDSGRDALPSQAASDSHLSSSAFGSPTPHPSASSPGYSGYINPFASSPRAYVAQKQRFWLFVRQQPRAGRACSNGKDRRAIDPPPIVQLQISDFDPSSPEDMEDIMDQSFVVHCTLCSASPPKRDISVIMCQDDRNGAMKAEKQILGSLSTSAFFCDEDPDPDTAPQHPSSQLFHPLQTPSPAASTRILPATFFCFSDLSVRRAGIYRLEFQLMRMRLDRQPLPILHSVLSDPFNVVNAKDFDHVQPSTLLVRGLLAKGAGFPLKLKQGSRAQRSPMEELED